MKRLDHPENRLNPLQTRKSLQLGRILFVKVSEICKSEIENITEQDCIDFIIALVIKRTFDGYRSEIGTIYGQLESILGVQIEPAPDEWDRRYNIDFFIRVDGKHIGLQIKPAGYAYIPQIINEIQFQKRTHEKFTERFGGKVFYVISVADAKQKIIQNKEVIEEIRKEISRLRNK